MTTLEQLRARLQEIVARQRELIESTGESDLSDDEQTEYDKLTEEFNSVKSRIEKHSEFEQREDSLYQGGGRRTPAPNPNPGPSITGGAPSGWAGAGQADRWEDEHGNRIATLAPDQSFREFVVAEHREPGESFDIGTAIRGLVTGKWPPGSTRIQSALSTGQDASGGYWLTPAMSAELIDLARNRSVVMAAGARTIPMPTPSFVMVRVTDDPTVAWTAENATIPQSQPVFGRLTFRARKLAARVPISFELANDAPNAASQIRNQLATVLAIEIDRVGLLGTADGEEPIGLFNAVGVQEISSVGSPDYDDFLDAIQLVENVNGQPNAYVFSPAVKNTLAKLKDSEGNYLAPPPDLGQLQRLVTKQLANSQAALGDFAQMLIGVLSQVRIEIAREGGDAWAKDQIEIKIRWRGDIQFARPSHLTKLTGIS